MIANRTAAAHIPLGFSAQAHIGVPGFILALIIVGVGISSREAFGAGHVFTPIAGFGIASGEAFGTAALSMAFAPIGIASNEASGSGLLTALFTPAGINSAEAFGSASLTSIIAPIGIASAEAFGAGTTLLALAPSGIASSEALGSGALLVIMGGVGIASSEAFGVQTFWLPTDATASLWLEGDSGVTSSGGLVTAWTDRSASAVSVTSSGALRPSLSTAINGRQGLSFSGATAMQVASMVIDGAKTIAIVAKLNGLPGASSFVSLLTLKDSSSGKFSEPLGLFNLSGYKNVTFLVDTTGSLTASPGYNPTLDTAAHDYVLKFAGGTFSTVANYSATLDGAAQTPVASGQIARVASDVGSIGGRLSSVLAVSAGANAVIAAIIAFPRSLNTTDTALLRSYLLSKYGI